LVFEQVMRAVAFEIAAAAVAAAHFAPPKFLEPVVGVDRVLRAGPAAYGMEMKLAKKPY
jgi:hypothetical protein